MNIPAPDLPLRDIHLPNSISWWPLAPGYWLLLCLLLFTVLAIFLWIRHVRKPTLRKTALKTLKDIENVFLTTQNSKQCLSELSSFLRRAVLSQPHDPNVAGLTGESWLKVLDRQLDTPEFSLGIGQLLLTGPYQKNISKEAVHELIQLCHKWVNKL